MNDKHIRTLGHIAILRSGCYWNAVIRCSPWFRWFSIYNLRYLFCAVEQIGMHYLYWCYGREKNFIFYENFNTRKLQIFKCNRMRFQRLVTEMNCIASHWIGKRFAFRYLDHNGKNRNDQMWKGGDLTPSNNENSNYK